MHIAKGKQYVKREKIYVVEVLPNGDVVVCNENDVNKMWVIDRVTFENTYNEYNGGV